MKLVFGNFFLIVSNVNIQFAEKELISRTYTTAKVLFTNQKIELINKEDFAQAALDANIKAFVLHVSSLSLRLKIIIHLARNVQKALLLAKKVTVQAKYSDFANVFLE